LVTRRLIAGFARQRRDTPSAPPCLTGSPGRESDVLRLITRGLTSAGIGATLVVTRDTTKTHVRHVLARLSLRDRAQAAMLACELAWSCRAVDHPRLPLLQPPCGPRP
jgi:DNA-binding NarL/FixJ family response regulator